MDIKEIMPRRDWDNDAPTKELATCIVKEKPLLMVGAGLSRLVGYPSWYELMLELKDALGSEVDHDDELLIKRQYDKFAEKLLSKSKRPTDLSPFIQERFGPDKVRKRYDKIHIELIGMPFCGVVTTNYDRVLEDAAQAHLYKIMGAEANSCVPRDLCYDEHGTFIFEFMRRLVRPVDPGYREEILHLHGYYEHPRNIVLTDSDYAKRYGRLLTDGSSENMEVTRHHKVLWSLLVTHPFVFFGFSMDDPYFMRITEIIKQEFELGSSYVKTRHYAVLPLENVEDQLEERLKSAGILPVLYEMPAEEEERHQKGLSAFLENLRVKIIEASVPKISKEEKDLLIESKDISPVEIGDEIDAREITSRVLKRL